MKRFLITAFIAMAGAIGVAPPGFATDVGVSVSIGQPGFYGRLDIGGYPPPRLIYSQPVIIEPVYAPRPPIYLRVPPGHAKHWSKHCRKYQACGERVYFVRDDWYQREYVPRYEGRHYRHEDRHERHDRRGDERWEERRGDHDHGRRGDDHDRGRGRGRDH